MLRDQSVLTAEEREARRRMRAAVAIGMRETSFPTLDELRSLDYLLGPYAGPVTSRGRTVYSLGRDEDADAIHRLEDERLRRESGHVTFCRDCEQPLNRTLDHKWRCFRCAEEFREARRFACEYARSMPPPPPSEPGIAIRNRWHATHYGKPIGYYQARTQIREIASRKGDDWARVWLALLHTLNLDSSTAKRLNSASKKA